MKITLKRAGFKTRTFKTAEAAGRYLEKLGWPEGLVLAPPADRVNLADVMQGSPWVVKRGS